MLSRSIFYRVLLVLMIMGSNFKTNVILAEELSPPTVEVATATNSMFNSGEDKLIDTTNQDSIESEKSPQERFETINETEEVVLIDAKSILVREDSKMSEIEEPEESSVIDTKPSLISVDSEKSEIREIEGDSLVEENYENHLPVTVELNFNHGSNNTSQGFFSSQSAQKPTIDSSVLDESIDHYLSNANQQELTLLTTAVDDDKVKVLEYIIKNQINEEYVATEVAEIKKYLTTEEINKLNSVTNPQEFQNLLRDFIKNYIQRRDFEILVDQLIVDSTKEEFDKLIASNNDKEFKTVLLDIAQKRSNQYSGEATHSNFRAGATVALPWMAKVAPAIIASAPKIFAGAVAIASSPITLGIVTIGAVGYIGYNLYNQAKISSQQRIQQRQIEYARARQAEINRQHALSLTQTTARANIQKARTQISHATTPTQTSWGNTQQVTQRSYAQAGVTAMRQSSYNPTFTSQKVVTPQIKVVQSVATGGIHTVKAGESVWLIANRYGISIANLVAWNGIVN